MANTQELTERTIADFGTQWTKFTTNNGYYADRALLADVLGPLFDPESIKGLRVAEIGAGTGRIINMLLDWGASEAFAIEPSDAVNALRENTELRRSQVQILQVRGDEIPSSLQLDLVLSIGVLHHIPEPGPVVQAARKALRPGGKMIAWLYGHEGNQLYLSLLQPLRKVSTHLPHSALVAMSHPLNLALDGYIALCKRYPSLPLAGYANHVIGKVPRDKRFLVVYDQLNPAYAKYYRRDEARALLEDAGFVDVQVYHRHEYSWTVIGTNPG